VRAPWVTASATVKRFEEEKNWLTGRNALRNVLSSPGELDWVDDAERD
jgi:hypothetical protein